ncbi:ABC transporter ATP-binding protein [Limimaricola pyoseonensis]|nr:ABC transporter ATP-binding protein [Limimaricola pyoseonensis]
MATVELERLNKRFGGFTALESLDLTIADGEFLVLLGPSGCGKSTTMRLVAGLEEPTGGEIRIGGRRVNDIPARDRDLAMVFQSYALYPHMTVGENIGYPLKVRGIAKAERQAQIRAAAEKVEMGHLLTRRPAELSGGQRQRVALARAIVRTPRLFLMDEPLSNLDAKLRTVMRAELKHLQRDLATTTIYVTHDQVEAMTLADRIVILNAAKIQQQGTPQEIYDRPANTFVASFIGSPPMNLIEGTVAEGRFHHPDGGVALASAPQGPAVLGVRPEDVTLAAPGEGDFTGKVYSSELLGDCTLLNVRVGDKLVAAKVGPQDGRDMDEPVGLRLAPGALHLFDGESGARIEGRA